MITMVIVTVMAFLWSFVAGLRTVAVAAFITATELTAAATGGAVFGGGLFSTVTTVATVTVLFCFHALLDIVGGECE